MAMEIGDRPYLGSSPLQQPEHVFTHEQYKSFIASAKEVSGLQDLDRRMMIVEEYRSRLPVYLLARCPFCGGSVTEPIDTFSLNGPGWRQATYKPRGLGWFAEIPLKPHSQVHSSVDALTTKPSYTAECNHVRIVDWFLNLNGLVPNDVTLNPYIDLTSEVPFLVKRLFLKSFLRCRQASYEPFYAVEMCDFRLKRMALQRPCLHTILVFLGKLLLRNSL